MRTITSFRIHFEETIIKNGDTNVLKVYNNYECLIETFEFEDLPYLLDQIK